MKSLAKSKPMTRRDRALVTRRRILRAAYDLFRERGYAGTTMEAIAKQADVAVQTLYFTFHTKAAILEETEGAAVAGFDTWVPPTGSVAGLQLDSTEAIRPYHPWIDAVAAAPSAVAALEVFLTASSEIMERAAPLTIVMRAAAEPDARSVNTRGEARRADAFRVVLKTIVKKPPGLREGVTLKRATDILLAVLSGEVYQMLRDRGWKPAEVHAWMSDVLRHQLLAE